MRMSPALWLFFSISAHAIGINQVSTPAFVSPKIQKARCELPALQSMFGATAPTPAAHSTEMPRYYGSDLRPSNWAHPQLATEPRFAGKAEALSAIPAGANVQKVVIKAPSMDALRSGRTTHITIIADVKDEAGRLVKHEYKGEGFVLRKFLSSQDARRHQMEGDPQEVLRVYGMIEAHPEIRAALDRGDEDLVSTLVHKAYIKRFLERYPDKFLVMDKATGTLHYISEKGTQIMVGGVDSTHEASKAISKFVVECSEQSQGDCARHAIRNVAQNAKLKGEKSALTNAVHGRAEGESAAFEDILGDFLYNYPEVPPHDPRWGHLWQEMVDALVNQHHQGGPGPSYTSFQEQSELEGLQQFFGIKGELSDDVDHIKQYLKQHSQLGPNGVAKVTVGMPVQIIENGVPYQRLMGDKALPVVDHQSQASPSRIVGRTSDAEGWLPTERRIIPAGRNADFHIDRHAVALLDIWTPNQVQRQAILRNPELRAKFHVKPGSNEIPDIFLIGDSNKYGSSEDTITNPTRLISSEEFRNPPVPNFKDLPARPWSLDQAKAIFRSYVIQRTFFKKLI